MKTNKRRTVFAVLLIIAIAFVGLCRMYFATFSNFTVDDNPIPVYYPQGAANEYKRVTFIIEKEDNRIWKYKLNKAETENIDKDLSNGVWQTVSDSEREYINKAYFDGYIFDCEKSDEIYYCLYDLDDENYNNLDIDDYILLCEAHLLFVYNRTASEYYCVSHID